MSELLQATGLLPALRVNASALALQREALEVCRDITKVTDADTQASAVAAQIRAREFLQAIEKSRKALKAPVLDFGRKLDKTASELTDAVAAEELRIARLVGDFQQAELARVRAAEAARNQELAEAERQRQQALAECRTLEERDRVDEEFNQQSQSMPEPIQAAREDGQIVKQDWDIVVSDVHALYRAHPNCCKLTPLMGEIKALLDIGMKVHGVTATKITKASVRVPKAIDV